MPTTTLEIQLIQEDANVSVLNGFGPVTIKNRLSEDTVHSDNFCDIMTGVRSKNSSALCQRMRLELIDDVVEFTSQSLDDKIFTVLIHLCLSLDA